MRFFSVLTAILVTAFLYLAVFQRDRLLKFAHRAPPPEGTAAAPLTVTPKEAPAETPKRVSVIARHSRAQTIPDTVVLRGETAPARRLELRAQTTAAVISEPMKKGALVTKGQVLCQLDPGARPARLAEAKARLAEAEINDRAAAKLSNQGFGSQIRASSAKAGLAAARSAVIQAETEIAHLRVTAPFGGFLETDTAELGTLLSPGTPCATILQLDPIRLVGFVPETEVARIRPGATGGGRLASGAQVSGRVTFVARHSDPATRTFRVELEIPNHDFALRAGQSAQILVRTGTESAHLLPQSAMVLNDAGDLGVRVIGKDNTVHFTPVRLLRDTLNGVWLAGLGTRADVIVRGQDFVTDGVKVDVSWQAGNGDAGNSNAGAGSAGAGSADAGNAGAGNAGAGQ